MDADKYGKRNKLTFRTNHLNLIKISDFLYLINFKEIEDQKIRG